MQTLKVLEFLNLFRWQTWTRDYRRSVPLRDYISQLSLSLVAIVLTVYLVTQGLIADFGVPVLRNQEFALPTPATVLDLFGKLSSGELSSVSCPCTNQLAPLSSVSSWTAPEDPLCPTMRELINDGFPGVSQQLLSFQSDRKTRFCIGDPNTNEIAWTTFLAAVNQTMVIPGNLFTGLSPLDNLDNYIFQFAVAIQDGLCGLAFGTLPIPTTNSRKPLPPFGPGPGPAPPIPPLGQRTNFNNMCAASDGTPERLNFLPQAFSQSSTWQNFVQMQQIRARTLFLAMSNTCNSLASLRAGFDSAVPDATLAVPFALSPSNLASAVGALWEDTLKSFSAPASVFVPGFLPAIEPLARFSDPFGAFGETFGGGGGTVLDALTPPPQYPVDAYPFSSRLPLLRTDFIAGGSIPYFVTGTLFTEEPVPLLAGEARVRANTAPGPYPFSQTQNRGPIVGTRATPGFAPGVTQDWVPIGDDFLSLIDSCFNGVPLSIDVHNLRPLDMNGRDGPAQSFDFLSPLCVYHPKIIAGHLRAPLTTYNSPQVAFTRSDQINLGPTNLQRCNMGAPPPPLVSPGTNRAPQAFLFNATLRCPDFIKFLGRLRNSSTYGKRSGTSRFSVDEYLRASYTPEQVDEKLRRGDLGERSLLLSTLLTVAEGPQFNHSPLLHYATCAPRTCTVSSFSQKDIYLEAQTIIGGTASTVVGLFSWAILLFSFCAQEACGGGGGETLNGTANATGGGAPGDPRRAACAAAAVAQSGTQRAARPQKEEELELPILGVARMNPVQRR